MDRSGTCIAGKIERMCPHGVIVTSESCDQCEAGDTESAGFNRIGGLVDVTIVHDERILERASPKQSNKRKCRKHGTYQCRAMV